MNRFDICEAYWCFYADWHNGGLTERCRQKGRGIAQQLHRMQFRPAMGSDYYTLEEDGREVYDALVDKYHPRPLKGVK